MEKKEKKTEGEKLSFKAKKRLSSAALTALVLAAAILLNALAIILTDKFSVFTADITSGSTYNIDQQSRELVHSIDKDVTIRFLSSKNTYQTFDNYFRQAVSVAEQLARESGGHVKVEYTDLVQNPNLQSKYPDVRLTTTDVIVSCGEKYNILAKEDMYEFESYASDYQYITASNAEQTIDEAILKVTSDISTKVVLVTDNSGDDFDYFRSVLKANNYDPVDITIEKDEIPSDAGTVILLAPSEDYSKDAVEKLAKFLNNDGQFGKGMIAIPFRQKSETPNIDELLSVYGLKFLSGLAFDMDTNRLMSTSYYMGILSLFASRQYTDGFTAETNPVLVSLARPVVSANDELYTPLLKLSSKSGFCDYDAEEETWSMTDAVVGSMVVMASGSAGDEDVTSTVVAAGSSQMFGEAYLQSQYSNQKYILQMMAGLNHREEKGITLEKKVITDYDITISQSAKITLGVILFAIVPSVIIAAGFVVWILRRRK